MLKVGLTGGIGSGKTTVSDIFESLGINIIDTDIIARNLVNQNTAAVKQIIDTFGKDIIDTDGSLDRKKLAAVAFESKSNKKKLEAILHPKIRAEVSTQIQALNSQVSPPDYIIIVIPLLFETNFHDFIDRTLVVIADEDIRINRVKSRDNRNTEQIKSIINHQVDDALRQEKADDIIQNNGNLIELESQITVLHAKYSRLGKT